MCTMAVNKDPNRGAHVGVAFAAKRPWILTVTFCVMAAILLPGVEASNSSSKSCPAALNEPVVARG